MPSERIELTYFKEGLIEDVIIKDIKPVISIRQKAEKEDTKTKEIKTVKVSSAKDAKLEIKQKIDVAAISEPFQDAKAAKSGTIDIGSEEGVALENYYLKVREIIKSRLEKNGKRFSQEGEVYVKFVINREGRLKDIMLYKNSSGNIPSLEIIAIKSIKEASPFPPFDNKINKAQLPFMLPIRFSLHP